MILIRCNRLLVRSKGRPAVYVNFELAKGESLGLLCSEESRLFFEALLGLRPYFGSIEINAKIGFMARSLPPPFLTVDEFASLHDIHHSVDKNSDRKIFTMSFIEKRMLQLEIALQRTNLAILDLPFYGLNDSAKKRVLELFNEYIAKGGTIIATFEKEIEFGKHAYFKNGKLDFIDEKDEVVISALNAYANLSNFSKKRNSLFDHEEDD